MTAAHTKVMILANSDVGLWSFRKEVVDALLKRGYEVVVSVPEGKRTPQLRELGCVIEHADIRRRSTNPFADFRLYGYYRRLLARVKPDVVLGYTIKPNIYGGLACASAGIPYIVNITGLGTAVENPGPLRHLTVGLYRLAMRKANCIFFQNKGNEKFFADRGIRNDIHRIIPGSGANLAKFEPMSYPENGVVRFLFISRVMKQKGIDEYLAAAEYFRNLYGTSVEFHILGACEEDYTDRLRALNDAGTVVYHGMQLDVRPFIGQSHCLIHPTYYPEGMSNVILEAASSARPVITTRRHGCMEAVDDGVTGFLFKERDREGLIKCVGRFLEMPQSERIEMGRRGRAKMEREFDRRIVIEAYLEEIDKALHVR